jgi:PAS domain S-box-containing protein
MKVWQKNRGSLRWKLLRSGLGIMALIGALSISTGVYFWGKFIRATEIRNITGRILTQRSLARIAEKDFRLVDLLSTEFYRGRTTRNLAKHYAAMTALEKEILELIRLSPEEEQEAPQKLYKLADEYRKDFSELVEAYRTRGFKEWGYEGQWRKATVEVEGYVERTQNVFAVRALLDLMRDEKDYLLQNESHHVRAIYEDLKQLNSMLLAQDTAVSTVILKALEDYETAFTKYVMIQRKIGITDDMGLQGELQRSGQSMEPILQEIRGKAFQAGERAEQTFQWVISLIWILGLGLGGTFFYFHAGSIANPIIQMKDAALKIGLGELDTRITIESDDEVGILAQAFNQMVADLAKTQEALRQSEEQSRLIIETASDAFVGIDGQGLITNWNHQAEQVFGWSREEAIGRRLYETIIPPPYRQAHVAGLQHFFTTGEGPVLNKRIEVTALRRGGQEFPVELTVWPVQTGQTYRFNAFVHDITERKQAEEAVRQSEERFRILTMQAPVGIFMTDEDGNCLFVNEGWCKMARMGAEEAQGQGWLGAIHTEDRQRVFHEWHHATQDGRPFASEYRFHSPEGKVIWLFGTAVALRNDAGQVTGYLGTVTDITERKEADQMKSDFVSFATHQLRTPLAGIKWLLELAREEPDISEDMLSYIQDARESADRLIKLVNDLLDISRLERGKLTIVPQVIPLAELTQNVLEEVSLLVQEKGHHLTFTAADEILPVLADQQLMRQVILNLVSNAIKYTPPEGEIVIEIGQEGAHLRWSIRDSGIGIPKEALPRLFEKFYRADNAQTIETEGTGLGLYLVRLILEQFTGRIWCESEEGKGTTFLFVLPLPESNQ